MGLRQYEAVMKAVSDPTRVRILKILESGEICVCQIIAVIALSQSTISKHLFLLRAAGLIKDRRDKKWIHYSLDGKSGNPYVGTLLRNIRKWLNDDPLILKDRDRAAMARDIGPVEICERGMALPGRKTLRSRPPYGRDASVAR
jgi:ArsR family transcriptional regulator, arsenate/arsenite/antimonite-responsive transcriptional repressor